MIKLGCCIEDENFSFNVKDLLEVVIGSLCATENVFWLV